MTTPTPSPATPVLAHLPEPNLNVSRRLVLLVVALAAVAAGVGGWLLGRQIESPAEAASRVAAPPASLISVPVELRELSSAVVTRGTIEFDQTTGIDVVGSETGSSIITRLTKDEGDDLVEGDVVIEVAGRPLFVLEGELPVFRTLSPGLEGPDVLQLEEALLRLGLDPGPVDGIYGARTEGAVEELYRNAGYRPPAVDVGEEQTLEAARDRVELAEDSLDSAREQANDAGLPRSQRLELDRIVASAQRNLDDLRSARDADLADLTTARDQANQAAADAQETFLVADARFDEAVAGTHPDTGAVPTQAEVDEFQSIRRTARRTRDALRDQAAELNEAHATASEGWNDQISDATIDVQIASAQRSETISQANSSGAADLVDQATSELADAREDLELLEREIGTRFPASELVFLPALPRLVQRVSVDVGDFPQGSVMDVSGNELAVVSGVSAADRALLEVGIEGALDDPNLGLTVPVVIDFIADSPGGPDLSSDRYRIRLVPTGEVPEEAYNQNLRLRIPISSTGGEVLAVPLAALSAAADGTSRVEKLIDDDTTELIDVRVGLSSAGFVEIVPSSGGLDAGDRVVVGRDQPDEVEVVDEAEQDAEDDEG